MRHSTTLPELLGTISTRRAFFKRVVVMGAAIPMIGSVLAACGREEDDDNAPAAACDAEPTATAASDTASETPAGSPASTAAASPTQLATAAQPPPTAASGQLAFAGMLEGAPASAVYLAGSDGAGLQAVWGWPTAGSHAVYLVWSPDGRRLAFYARDAGIDAASGGYTALFWLDPDQGQTTNLNLAGLLDVDFMWGPPTWSPDGRLLYVSLPPLPAATETTREADGGILAIPVDGSAAATKLITWQELDMQNPTLRLSPDGRMIAASVGEPPQLVMVRVDDPQVRGVVDELIMSSAPVWSPDSRQIAFIAQLLADGIGQLYVVNADGTGLSQLTDHQPTCAVASGGTAADPAWSPDGRQIAYTVLHDATQQVYVSAVDGSQTRNLSNDPERADTGPSWSPDGREIAVVSQPAEAWRAGEEPVIRDIRVSMADGTDSRTVVAGVQGVPFEPFDMQLTGLPAWRPTAP